MDYIYSNKCKSQDETTIQARHKKSNRPLKAPEHYSEGRVVGTYEKHYINASLKKMEAIFHEEVKIELEKLI